MKKILISGLGGSLFPYLSNYLLGKYELVFIDSNPYLKKVYPTYNFYTAPLVTDSNYEVFIKEIIQKEKVDFYIPLIDEELIFAKNVIEEFNRVKVISPSVNFINLSLNKFDLMKRLEVEKISQIDSYTGECFDNQIIPPLFLKPISGRGSRGIRRISSFNQIQAYYKLEERLPKDTLIQPAIEGQEYTVGVTINDRNDIIAISSKKVISKKGITQLAITENNGLIDDVIFKLVNTLKPCGPINVQLFLTDKNEVKIFEINPRFSTTTIMEYQGGLDLISLYINFRGKDYTNEILRPEEGVLLYRRWENLFL